MLFNIVILVLLAGIAYFHFAQGLFAATISAFCAGVAALMAFSYHETIVVRYTGGAMGGYSNAVVLCGLFALIYVVMRVITDNFIPGNVRYPVALDKVGAAVMGVVAGFFATAIVAIAAQELPFGPTVLGYSPYPVADEELNVPRFWDRQYGVDDGSIAWNFNQLQVKRFDTQEAAEQRQELWVPVDTLFLGLVATLSDRGALAGESFTQVHPDFKTAIFGHRLGMQRAATQIALNLEEGNAQAQVRHIFRVSTGASGQFPEGLKQAQGDLGGDRQVDKWLNPGPGKTLLVLRVEFARSAADPGGFVRFSPGTARLVISGEQYFPIATLESGEIAVSQRPDDYLLAGSGGDMMGADLVYEVDSAAIQEGPPAKLASPAFFEFKRYGRDDLSGARIYERVTPSPLTHIARKIPVQDYIGTRIADISGGGGNMRDLFSALRGSVPSTEPDPEAAEREAGIGVPADPPAGESSDVAEPATQQADPSNAGGQAPQ